MSTDDTDLKPDRELDCRGLKCPLPVLKTRKMIETMASGQVLRVLSDLPGSVKCLVVWSEKSGNEIVGKEQNGPVSAYYIRCK